MEKEENVIKYYVLCSKLKDLIRTGWKDWNVNRKRVESVAEHIYGVQMLALAIYSEYKYDIDINKVIKMIAIHELEEIEIGDITLFAISREDKRNMGKAAVLKVLEPLTGKDELINLINEFEERKTKEALFAYYCDKLECDIQSKLYDEENCVDLNHQENNLSFFDEDVQKYLEEEKTWSGMWLRFGQERYKYDDNFKSISNYVKNNSIIKYKK